MNTTVETSADVKPATENRLARLVRVLTEITDLAERYGVAEHCDGNIIEARELVAECQTSGAITETDIAEFFVAKAKATGREDIALGFDTNYYRRFTARSLSDSTIRTGFGDTIADAIAEVLAQIKSPAERANALRQEAAKLLGQADLIEHAAEAEKGVA